MVRDTPESVIHLYLTFGNGVADRAIAPPTRARAANRRTTGWLVDKAIATFAVAVVGSLGAVALELGGGGTRWALWLSGPSHFLLLF